MITLRRLLLLEALLRQAGYGEVFDWSEAIAPPQTAEAFAREAIYVICNSGMRFTVAGPIYERCIAALDDGRSATQVFGHPGKSVAIDTIWRDREALFEAYQTQTDSLAFLHSMPWIGPVTRYHLAKNLGADTAKPDVHLERLARRDKISANGLCRRLARKSGYKIATIDTILWQACADGLLDSRKYERDGWKAAFNPGALAKPD